MERSLSIVVWYRGIVTIVSWYRGIVGASMPGIVKKRYCGVSSVSSIGTTLRINTCYLLLVVERSYKPRAKCAPHLDIQYRPSLALKEFNEDALTTSFGNSFQPSQPFNTKI